MTDRLFALAIAGGRGERLRPLTDDTCKPMVQLNDWPIISYQVAWMRSQGVTDVVFLTGYRAEKIREFFGDGSRFGVTAHYSHEDEPLGRGGAVRKGLGLVPESAEFVIVTNGDVITNQPLEPMLKLHRDREAIATLMLSPFPSQFGVVESDDSDMITAFVEKGMLPFWVNAGTYIFNREIEQMLPEEGDHETTTFQQLVEERKLAAFKSKADWLTVDSPKDVREVGERLSSGEVQLLAAPGTLTGDR